MDTSLHHQIEAAARRYFSGDDPSHDFEHVRRVLKNAQIIQAAEGGDNDIIVAAVLFHDCVNYPKNDPRAARAAQESADAAACELAAIPEFSAEKIAAVTSCIVEHSFSAGLKASSLESQIVQDADRLEATGAIAIMRTYASTGQMMRPFYDAADPFAQSRTPDTKDNALDLFFIRLLKVRDGMNTPSAKAMAAQRTEFLNHFLEQFASEIGLICPASVLA